MLGFLPLFIRVIRVTRGSISGFERPEPHGGETGIFLEAGGVGAREDHGEGLLGDGGPDLLQVFLERDGLAAGHFDSAITREDFQGRA